MLKKEDGLITDLDDGLSLLVCSPFRHVAPTVVELSHEVIRFNGQMRCNSQMMYLDVLFRHEQNRISEF